MTLKLETHIQLAHVGLAFQPTRNPTATASVTLLIDPQRDDLIDTLGHLVMNLQNTPPTAPIADPPTITNQWKDQPNVVEQFNFMDVPGLKVNMNSKEPIDFFKLFVTGELINTMVLETKKYPEQEIKNPFRKSPHLKDWKAITADDMRNFLGIILHMGCVKLPSFEHHWSKNELCGFRVFSKVMLQNKFQLMLRFWHVGDNEHSPGGRLSKIMPLVVQLNNKMATIYTLDRKLSIDESIMLWRRHLIFRQ